MTGDLLLCIDVGTGSVRAAAVDLRGRVLHVAHREHEQIVPRFGWAEQAAEGWWDGVVAATRDLLDTQDGLAGRLRAIAVCGQMHGTVLVDDQGLPTRPNVPLWNDKRTSALVREFERAHDFRQVMRDSGNPATPAWPGFKLAWLRAHDPQAYARAHAVLMPKDFINFRLTGEMAMDPGDASLSFLMDPATRRWSGAMIERLGLDAAKLPPLRQPLEILGDLRPAAASALGLPPGLPVLVGSADYPVALLGSGVCQPGLASDVTGTSCIITSITGAPVLDAAVCNMATVEGNWGAFILLETGGDAVRWARRALHERRLSYEQIMDHAGTAPAGSDGLFFLPYLAGERLGEARNARAQFFGLSAAHTLAHLDRALIEGVAFSAARALRLMERLSGERVQRVVATSGGAKSPLWLRIKASAYNLPIEVPGEAEGGLVGCAMMAATALGHYSSLQAAAQHCVRIERVVEPDPAWAERYARMQPVFDRLYEAAKPFYDALDALADGAAPGTAHQEEGRDHG